MRESKKPRRASHVGVFLLLELSALGQFLIGHYAWAQEDQEFGFIIYDLAILEKPTQNWYPPHKWDAIFRPRGVLNNYAADDYGVAVIDQELGLSLLGADGGDVLDGPTEVSFVFFGEHLQSDLAVRGDVRRDGQRQGGRGKGSANCALFSPLGIGDLITLLDHGLDVVQGEDSGTGDHSALAGLFQGVQLHV
mgnify:CR=1 FL=1